VGQLPKFKAHSGRTSYFQILKLDLQILSSHKLPFGKYFKVLGQPAHSGRTGNLKILKTVLQILANR